MMTSIILVISISFTYTIYNGYLVKQKLRTTNIRFQTVKNIIRKRLSLAIKESIKIRNNIITFESVNYTSLIGLFKDNYWYSLFSYDKNTSKQNILYITNIDLKEFNTNLKKVEDININDLYLKFNNNNTYYKIKCFNCNNMDNIIKLEIPNKDINQSSYFLLIKSSYIIKLEDNILFLYYNFKKWLNEPYKNKSILLKDVKSFNVRTIKEKIAIDICLKNNLCDTIYSDVSSF